MKDRIANLLANGVTAAQAAIATGVSESYISQLRSSDESFSALLQQKLTTTLEQEHELQDTYDTIEQEILNEVSLRLPTADIRDLAFALQSVTRANPKRAKNTILNPNNATNLIQNNTAITVNLPTHVLQDVDIQLNARNEIVAVDGQSMLQPSISDLQEKLKGEL